ncbi:hypothetical protein [Kitasatospora camelliae]|uniref:Outer membrane channel protein CpnT-like N-terminal domain-containing protein n=1 Tax=Kitasatospora camelliae TaxID=3156397 RepID=A0AAU8K4P7_9ACTN
MALELPPELVAVLELLGLDWPQVNEDELVRLAEGLRGLASTIDSVQMTADKALTALGEVYHGTSADKLAGMWETVSKYSGLVVDACGVAATALNAAALVIEGCKGATVVQLVATQGELVASSLIGPEGSAAVVAAGRQILSTILEEAVSALGQALAQPVADLVETVVKQLLPGDGPGSAGGSGAGFGVDLAQLASCALELRSHADDLDSHSSSFRQVVENLDLGAPGDAFGRLVIAAAEQIATSIGVEVLKRLLGSFRGTADRMDQVAQNLTENEDSHTRQMQGILSKQDSPSSPRPLQLAGGAGDTTGGGRPHHGGPVDADGPQPGPHQPGAGGILVGGGGAGRAPGPFAPDRPGADRPMADPGRAGLPPQQPRAAAGGPHPGAPYPGPDPVPPRSDPGFGAGHRGPEPGPLDRGPAAQAPGIPGPAPYGPAGGGMHQGGPGGPGGPVPPGGPGAGGPVRDAPSAPPSGAPRPRPDAPAEDPAEFLAPPPLPRATTDQDA